jgi:hypothetical protein
MRLRNQLYNSRDWRHFTIPASVNSNIIYYIFHKQAACQIGAEMKNKQNTPTGMQAFQI